MPPAQLRRALVAAVRRGDAQREVARRFGVSLDTVQRWSARAGRRRLERVDFRDRPAGNPAMAQRLDEEWTDLVVALRKQLKDQSALGEYGAAAMQRELRSWRLRPCPALRTLPRILERQGLLDARRRLRHPAAPPGWYLPELAAQQAEWDRLDVWEELALEHGPGVDVRFPCASLPALRAQAQRFVQALRERQATRREQAPARRPFPRPGSLRSTASLRGRLVYLRRTSAQGTVHFLGLKFRVSRLWMHRLVRAEVHLELRLVRFFALRRREPHPQPWLRELHFHPKFATKSD